MSTEVFRKVVSKLDYISPELKHWGESLRCLILCSLEMENRICNESCSDRRSKDVHGPTDEVLRHPGTRPEGTRASRHHQPIPRVGGSVFNKLYAAPHQGAAQRGRFVKALTITIRIGEKLIICLSLSPLLHPS